MKTLARSLALVSSLALLAVGCADDQADDLTASEEALLTCDGSHNGDPGKHRGHRHHRHHHHHHGSGGIGGVGGRPHLMGAGGSAGSSMGGSAGGDMGGSTGGGGTGGGMVDPRCTEVSGIVSWWHGDGDYDDGVGSNDGASAGGVSFAAGQDGQGFALNATPGSFVEVPHDPSLMMGNTFTLDAWINPTTLNGRIIDKATAGGLNGYMIDLPGGWLRLFIGDGGQVVSTGPVPISMFTHIAAVFDNGKMGLYFNGVLNAETQIARLAPPPNALTLRIGADSNGNSLFDGIIDEPRVFNRALTADEITLLYWQGTHCQ